MDKTQALKVLINNSIVITPFLKKRLIENIDTFTQEEIDELGSALAYEVKFAQEHKEKITEYTERIAKKLISLTSK